jgi:hypothetical protein
MPGAKKNFIGLEGFVWWIGVVEDRQDPEQLGRVRVRCFGWHTNEKDQIPTDALPWAHPVIPVNNPAAYTPKEGDHVFGFFMDGDQGQTPVIVGVLPGKPEAKPNYEKGFSDPRKDFASVPKKPDDSAEAYPKSTYLKEASTNRLSRGKADSTVIATRKKNLKSGITSAGGVSWSEPPPAFAPKYPYNNALETESGHALEFDDTPGQERVHLAHRKGSFIEIDKDGNEVHKVVKDNYEVIMGSDYVFVGGKCSITVAGDCNLKVGGNLNVEANGGINMSAGGDVRIKGKSVFAESASDMNLKSGAALNATGAGAVNIKGGSAVAIGGSSVEITSPLNVSGETNLTVSGSTELASGSGPHRHTIIKQPVAGSGASSASSASGAGITGGGSTPDATDAAAATAANKTIESAVSAAANVAESAAAAVSSITTAAQEMINVVDTIGKNISGVTETISGVFNSLNVNADSLISDLTSRLPIGELTQKVQVYENATNLAKGTILSLRDDLKGTLINKIGDIKELSALRNIDFNVDPALLPQQLTEEVRTVIGKRLYPLTETLTANNILG